jgi:membrane fusion protein (multidrug efflux system)
VAVQGVMVSADLPGVVDRVAFESGRAVQAGELLLTLDASQERAQLAAAVAQRDLARLERDRKQPLAEKGYVSLSDYDRAVAEYDQAEARIAEIRATVDRKTIRAPFAGILGIRQVNLGQYLRSGDPIVQLQSLDPIYVEFAVPQQDLAGLSVGREVRVEAEGLEDAFAGAISAVDSVVDAATRNVQVQATLRNAQAKLRPGMYVKTQVVRGAGSPVLTLPASAISYAPYGDSVFVVESLQSPQGQAYTGVRQQFVKLGPSRGDQVAVVSGLAAGAEVVTSGAFKLRNGAAVVVNNDIQPSNSATPEPEDS